MVVSFSIIKRGLINWVFCFSSIMQAIGTGRGPCYYGSEETKGGSRVNPEVAEWMDRDGPSSQYRGNLHNHQEHCLALCKQALLNSIWSKKMYILVSLVSLLLTIDWNQFQINETLLIFETLHLILNVN